MHLPKTQALQYLLLTAACLVCYGNTLPHDYAYDDSVVITENKFTQQGFAGIPGIFKNNTFAGSYEGVPILERYRPLSLATFAIEHQLFGQRPSISHLGNVLLFALSVLLLHAFLRKLFAAREDARGLLDLPFIAALLFAVHPIHTEIVANIKGRDEILALAGSLLAMLLLLKYLDARKPRHLALVFLLFLMALFSKENALTFLAVAPLTVLYYKRPRWADTVYALLPLVIASAVFLGVRQLVLASPGRPAAVDIITEPFAYATGSERIATVFHTLGRYLGLLFFPHPLTIDYYPFHIQLQRWTSLAVWPFVVAYLAIAAYAFWNLGKRSVVSYGILFYLATLSMVSNLPFSMGTFMSERFMFAPSVGFAIVVAHVITSRAVPSLRLKQAVVLALALACSLKTISRNTAWKDDFTLFTTDVKTSAGSIKANLAASVTFLMESQKTRNGVLAAEYRAHALDHARSAVSLYRENVEPARRAGTSFGSATMLLCNCESANGRIEEALQCLRGVVGTASDRAALTDLIQTTINQSDDVDLKIRSYTEFARLLPDSFSFNYHLGLLYGKDKQNLPSAIVYFRKAVEIAPHDVNALRGLAHAYSLSHDYDNAALCFESMVVQDPGNLSLLSSLRDLYERAGNQTKASAIAKRMEELAEGRAP